MFSFLIGTCSLVIMVAVLSFCSDGTTSDIAVGLNAFSAALNWGAAGRS